MNISSIDSKYINLLKLDQEMGSLQADLAEKLAAGDKNGAEADIQELKALDTNMALMAHEAKMTGGGYLEGDISSMEESLNGMMMDVQKGDFSSAATLNETVKADTADIFHVIVI